MNKEFGRQKSQAWNGVRIRYEEDNEGDGEEEEEDDNISPDEF